ncbi:ATP-grasp domain-containing protein [Agrobacterium rubi]|nr:ATP-grasp domain-containing protein [Agrobacterium rubi]NTF24931.1 ATP-grasp domain-containing protein [Agrobacterium rubi]
MNYDKPVLLIQNNYFEKLGRLIQPCLDFCYHTDHDIVDRSLTDDFDPDALGVDWSKWPGVILYGSVGWVKRCRKSSLSAWAFHDPHSFASSTWVPIFGSEALNGDGQVLPVGTVRERLLSGETLHLRPDCDDKAFVGAVHDIVSWDQMIEGRQEERQLVPADDLMCFASPVKAIVAEFRCWFVDGVLIDISTYRKDGKQHIERCLDPLVMGAAERLAEKYLPNPSVVMDLADTAGGFKIIEFNPICSSGWYAAHTAQILWAMSDMIRRGRS